MIPREYIPAVKKGIEEAVLNGVLGGYPVIDVEVESFTGVTTKWIPTNWRSKWQRFLR